MALFRRSQVRQVVDFDRAPDDFMNEVYAGRLEPEIRLRLAGHQWLHLTALTDRLSDQLHGNACRIRLAEVFWRSADLKECGANPIAAKGKEVARCAARVYRLGMKREELAPAIAHHADELEQIAIHHGSICGGWDEGQEEEQQEHGFSHAKDFKRTLLPKSTAGVKCHAGS